MCRFWTFWASFPIKRSEGHLFTTCKIYEQKLMNFETNSLGIILGILMTMSKISASSQKVLAEWLRMPERQELFPGLVRVISIRENFYELVLGLMCCKGERVWSLTEYLRILSQPQLNLNLTQLSWVWHDNGFAHHHPPHPSELNIHHMEPQINLWCWLTTTSTLWSTTTTKTK